MSITKATLSKIHIARQQLRMDDDIYRGLLGRVAGVRSAKELNTRQASAVLRELERLGFKPAPSPKAKGKPHNFNKLPAEIEVIEAQLADMKLPWSYADRIAKQMFGVARVAWLKKPDQVKAILAALHVEQEKRGLLESVKALCEQLGIEHPEQVMGLEQLPKDWKRQRPILKALVKAMQDAVDARRAI
ncbi:gp16 family protein [Stutzerimonas nitrititolerans]|uniref:gp16 family protein n=1 Tax=Stutzerimonas nitrititolerans TaxID=2482751 RepID=UPI00289DAE6E|nr:regulatory protein GemA [Stutzerimonas nitrititolerans]